MRKYPKIVFAMALDYKKLIGNYFHIFEAEYPPFKKAAKFGTGFIVLGVFMLYMQYIEVFNNVSIVSVVFIAAGLVSFWLWVRPFLFFKKIFYTRPADGDMDIWFHNDLHEIIKPRALELLHINPSSLKEENIIFVPYPVYWNIPGAEHLNPVRRAGDDGAYIYSVWGVQVLVVTENYVSYYACYYDWVNDQMLNERTNEYFFDDISSVRNDEENLSHVTPDKDESPVGTARVFKLTNMSGDSLTVITDVPSLNIPPGYANNLERLVQALRIMLRNRRYGEEIEPIRPPSPPEEAPSETGEESRRKHSPRTLFHQELRKLHEEYSQEMDAIRKAKNKAYRGE